MNKLYRISPVFIQNYFCSLYGAKIRKERFNSRFFLFIEQLTDSQFSSEASIKNYKEEHLFRIIEHAYNNVPFYKDYYKQHHITPKDFKSLDDIMKFPVITKEQVRNNFSKMLARDFPHKDLIPFHTSGSSGKALDFFQTKDTVPFIWAVWWRFRNRFGVSFGEKHLNCTGKIVVPIKQNKPPYWRVNKPLNQWLVNMQHITNNKIHDIVDLINREEFVYFSGYPSIISSMASLILENDLKIINPPKVIFTGAEKLYEDQKSLIKKAFTGTIITDHYGMTEGVVNASRCNCNNFYHEDFELGHMECLDSKSISLTDYEGDIIGTSFINYGMPFIRYHVGDSAIWSSEHCDCGLHSQVIKDIIGRSEDFVITPEGTKIKRFDYLFKETRSIKECQVIQRELGSIVFRIVRRDDYSRSVEDSLKKKVNEMISPSIECLFEYVNEIERTSSGKFKAVVSELK